MPKGTNYSLEEIDSLLDANEAQSKPVKVIIAWSFPASYSLRHALDDGFWRQHLGIFLCRTRLSGLSRELKNDFLYREWTYFLRFFRLDRSKITIAATTIIQSSFIFVIVSSTCWSGRRIFWGHVACVYVLMPLCVYANNFRTQQNLCQGNICLYVFMPLCCVFLILGMLHCFTIMYSNYLVLVIEWA